MASNDFTKILVKDDTIGCLSSSISYAVFKGGQNVTQVSFNSVSASTSQVVWNIQVPSLETIISRDVKIKSNIRLKISDLGVTRGDGNFLVYPSMTDALSAMPMNQIIQTGSVTINNNTVTSQISDVLQVMLRSFEPEVLAKYNGGAPTAIDYNYSYKDAIIPVPAFCEFGSALGVNNPVVSQLTGTARYISLPNNVLGGDITRNAGSTLEKGRATLMQPFTLVGDTKTALTAANNFCYIDIETTEPLMMSPFIFGDTSGKSGMYGVSNLTILLNLGSIQRCFRYADINGNTLKTIEIADIKSTLIFEFITPHPSDLLSARCVIPYYEMPVYKTTVPNAIEALSNALYYGPTFNKTNYPTVTINSQSLQFNVIPDKIFIFVRKLGLTAKDSDTFLPIKKLSISFNNANGLLSSATQQQLWQYSQEAGLVNQSWDMFSGETVKSASSFYTTGTTTNLMPQVNGYAYTDCNKKCPTSGGIVSLLFGRHIQISEDYYAPGSLGSFQFQIIVDCYNHTPDPIAANGAELVIITVNSGIMSIQSGTSSIYTGLLTKSDVLAASSQEVYTQGEVKRLMGSGFLDDLKSGMNWMTKRLPQLKEFLIKNKDIHPAVDTGAKVLGALGYAKLDKRIM